MRQPFRGIRPRLIAAAFAASIVGLGSAAVPLTASNAATPANFSISTDRSSITMSPGQSATVTLTVTRGKGFTSAVFLGARSLPRGFRISTGATSIKGKTATVKISVDSSVAPKTYNVVLSASSKGKSSQKTVKVAVVRASATTEPTEPSTPSTPPLATTTTIVGSTTTIAAVASSIAPPASTTTTTTTRPGPQFSDYNLVAEQPSVNITTNGIAQAVIKIERTGGFADSLEMIVEGLPTGVSGVFSPVLGTSNSTTLTLRSTSAPVGSFEVKVRARGRETKFLLSVQAGPAITYAPTAIAVTPSGSTTALVRWGRSVPTGTVTWTATNLPAGITVGFAGSVGVGIESTMTVNATATAVAGTFTLTATSGTLTDSVSVPVTIGAASTTTTTVVGAGTSTPILPVGTATVTPTAVNVGLGAVGTVVFTPGSGVVIANGGLALTQTGLPVGVTIPSATPSGNSLSLPITVGASAAPGTYVVTITLAQGANSTSGSFALTVGSGGNVVIGATTTTAATTTTTVAPVPSGFTLSATPNLFTVARGSTVSILITAVFTGPQAPISYTIDGAPTGTGISFSANPSAGDTSIVLRLPSGGNPIGTNLIITGTIAGRAAQTITVPLNMT